MALVECYECGKLISDAAPACPNCGAPAKKTAEKEPYSSLASETNEKVVAKNTSNAEPQKVEGASIGVLLPIYIHQLFWFLFRQIWLLFRKACENKAKVAAGALLVVFLIDFFNKESSKGAAALSSVATPAPAPAPQQNTSPSITASNTQPQKPKGLDEAEERKARYAAGIPEYALKPYSPGTFKKFSSRKSEIEKFRRMAAERAIDSGKCDKIVIVELSQVKSTLHDLHFFLDCENSQRITFSEQELKDNAVVQTAEDRSWDCVKATTACGNLIRSNVNMPSRLDLHTLMGSSCYKAPLTFNVVVSYDFGYKNDYGVQDEFTAKCHFEPGKNTGSIEVFPKQ